MKKTLTHLMFPLVLLLCLFSMSACSGCSGCLSRNGHAVMLNCPRPATDTAVKTFFSQKVSVLTSIPFTVDITDMEPLSVPTALGISGKKDYRDVPGGHKFTVEITIKAPSGSYKVIDYYEDEYVLNASTTPASSTTHYVNAIYLHNMMDSFTDLAKKAGIGDCTIMADPGNPDYDCAVFLYSSDYDALAGLLGSYKEAIAQKEQRNQGYSSYGVYIFTDKSAYDSIDFKSFLQFSTPGVTSLSYGGDVLPYITGKSVARIDTDDTGLSKDFFSIPADPACSYVVFWASAEPNIPGDCRVQLFGVK